MSTKNTIVEHLKSKAKLGDGESKEIINLFFQEIIDLVKNDFNLKLYGFGTFKKSSMQKRRIRSINTGEIKEITIPEKIKFQRNKKKA